MWLAASLLSVLTSAPLPAAALDGYARLLSARVKDGRVDYQGIERQDRPALDGFLKAVGEASVPEGKDQALAFYIDAYNALVIRAVIDAGRPRSVLDVKGFFDGKTHVVTGKKLTLNQLEKEVIIPLAKPDPRPHMALVCAAFGCPILDAKPYSGADLDRRLTEATRRYLASPRGARLEGNELKLSKIFDWYRADFGGEAGVWAFARKHLPEAISAKLAEGTKLGYLDYNWTLNQQ